MRVILDVSSLAWRCLLSGTDEENGFHETDPVTGKERYINSAAYGWDSLSGYLKRLCEGLAFAPKDMILVLDGAGGRQLRSQFHSAYKAGRDKSQAMYDQYNKLERLCCDTLVNLGAQVVYQRGVEADDVIGYLCETIKEDRLLVVSHDKDMLVCAKYPNVTVWIQEQGNPYLFGNFPFQFIDVYKATVGDPSDNIPGAKGFGPKAFEAMYQRFGDNGLAVLRKLIQERKLKLLEEDVPALPQLQKLIDYAPDVEMSLKCAKLYPNYVQPEKMEWRHGVCRAGVADVHPNLAQFAQRIVGVTAANFAEVFQDVQNLAAENPLVSLDIETTTPDESDEWLFEIRQEESKQVDVFGSELTGLSITLGGNFQHTFYFSVGHADTDNVSLEQVEQVLRFLNQDKRFVIQNVNFELVVLHNTFGWFLRDIDDTKLMASYVDENSSLGLKPNSKRWLGYEQATYDETVTDADGRKRKMHELTLAEVLAYGADDTICTAALYQWYQLHMYLETVWRTYRDVEIGAAYWVAQAFIDGVKIDQVTLRDMIARDKQAKAEHQAVLDEYLIAQGWDGTRLVEATEESRYEPTWLKYAFEVVYGKPLDTRVRKFERLLDAMREQGGETLADILEHGSLQQVNQFVQSKFSGSPQFNVGSPKQMQKLLYEVMGLPIRLRNKPTDTMRAAGITEGNPQTDELAVQSALHYDVPADGELVAPLKALLGIKTMNTRFGLYYTTYPQLPHWKDNRIHAGLNQCATVTRRFTSNNPNLQQLSKGAGDFRRIFVPHHKDAMIVSLDFSAQELRLIAEQSQDPNMLSCYVGDNRRDMHSLTGAEIAKLPYEEFKARVDDEEHPQHKWAKAIRAKGKTTNFASAYGAAAPKMAQTLMVTEDEAQSYLDAKSSAFARTEEWKQEVIADAHKQGFVRTMLGVRRHLPDLQSSNKWEVAKAERQAVNFKIQGSGAEMTKLAMGRMWQSGIRQKFDMRFVACVHDEVIFSISMQDIPRVVPSIHAAMTAKYADMSVPVESSISMGKTLGDQHEFGSRELVEQVLQQFVQQCIGEAHETY
ncbi:DNA polymerase [Eikenella sp. HMSC061C02]|uniref:DNA polymerase n=1 Tax=Eikenella sp. HMSC061C02 TaxID=1715021 RepID=UPI0008A40E45|nr:DNA polymerase [Eikenella sp. HMSC061C02]OFN60547.1 hypothetical protein HMPREF2541_07555 [Eikenella sp. HMSC061C02]